ncbi:MAG: polysaccharide pyruvyl transferase family protein [Promethearchaeota archaeon]
MQILYLKNWPTNIGNTFIDLGAIYCLKKALPNAKIYAFGGLGRRLLHASKTSKLQKMYLYYAYSTSLIYGILKRNKDYGLFKKHYHKLFVNNVKYVNNFFDLSHAFQANFVVVSGCILTYQLGLFLTSLQRHKKKGRKIIFYAVGGSSYSASEIETIRDFLKKIKPYAFISRDREAFNNYCDLAEHVYNGIDAAFFVSSYFSPPHLQLPEYVVFNFDKQEEPKINVNCDLIIRTSHYTYPPIASKIVEDVYKRPNILISDNPLDYLILYANAREVHTDRVHTCVITTSYGKPCKLYFRTKRALILDRVNLEKIRDQLTKLDLDLIQKEKKKQIEFLREILLKY